MVDVRPTFRPAGDTGLVIEFGEHIDRVVSRLVLALQARIHAARLPGVVETVPTFGSLLIHLDPDTTSVLPTEKAVIALLRDLEAEEMPLRRWVIPVCYESAFAPDLGAVAEQCSLTPSQVVEIHRANEYHVYMIGFLPGFPYIGDLPQEIVLPRRPDPRLNVPPGSVAIATTLTAIYPLQSPGGWHLIGRTPVRLFDIGSVAPALLSPGDKVTFAPISPDEFADLEKRVESGQYELRAKL